MARKSLLCLALGLALMACEREKGAGFTGIGKAPTQGAGAFFPLDFRDLTQDGPQTTANQSGSR